MTQAQKAKSEPVYKAVLRIDATLVPPEDLLKKEPFKLPIGEGALGLYAPMKKRQLWFDNGFPEGEQALVLYPRTDHEGYLARGTLLTSVRPIETCSIVPGLHAVGQLTSVRPDLGTITLKIYPNVVRATLKEPFWLPLQISLEGISMLPEVGKGLELWADFKPRSGRLVVTKLRAIPLPPRARKDQRKKAESVPGQKAA